MAPYMAKKRHPLNNQVLTIFFSSATIAATLRHSEFTDEYSPQYVGYRFCCIS